MLEEIKKINISAKIFNVNSSEWLKVLNTMVLRFLYKASFVIAWTLIITLFVEMFGVRHLPLLFVVNAFFSILGSLYYTNFLYKFSHFKLMLVFLILSGLGIIASKFAFGYDKRLFLFILIFIESVFLIQFKILLNAFLETAFSPLQSERLFPFTESSETIGAIVAGILLFSFSSIFSISSFLYFWLIFLFLLIPFLIYFDSVFVVKTEKHEVRDESVQIGFKSFLKKEIFNFNKLDFIKGLALIVFLQWFLFNLVEFQYISAVYSNVKNVIVDAGSGFENAFIHDLGAFFVLFNLSVLFCQLILASRLINSLGIVGAMILHPIITCFSFILFLFNGGFYPILFAKNNFMISSVVLNNSYHCSFYAIKDKYRDFLRQFLEGIIRPIGALVGTMFLLAGEYFFSFNSHIFFTLIIIAISLYFFRVVYLLQKEYFNSAIYDLRNSTDLAERKNAIEILAQKGGRGFLRILISVLNSKDEKISIKIKILEVLGQSHQIHVLNFILRQLKTDNHLLKTASLDALSEFFQSFKLFNSKYLLLRLKIISELKLLFHKEKNDLIRLKIIKLLTQLSGLSTLEFLMKILEGDNIKLKNEAIRSLGNYKNSNVESILVTYLKSGNISYQINAAIALSKLKDKQKSVLNKIDRFIYNKEKIKVLSGIYAIGEIKLKSKKRFLLSKLYSNDLDIKKESALALSKMGYFESIPSIIELLLHENIKIAKNIKSAIKLIDAKVFKQIQKLLKLVVFEKIDIFKKSINFQEYSRLDKNSLSKLRLLYSLAEDFDEVENINKFLKQ